jgi:predicted RNA-binding protein
MASRLDHIRQHLLDTALASFDLFGDVQRFEGVVERLGLDRLRQLDLVVGGEQVDATDLFEVHPHRVVERGRIHHLDVEQHLVIDLLDVFEVLLAVGDLDPEFLEGRADAEDLVRLGIDLGEALEDVVGGEVALFLALDDQLPGDRRQLVFELVLRILQGLAGGLGHGLGYARKLWTDEFRRRASQSWRCPSSRSTAGLDVLTIDNHEKLGAHARS